MDISFEGWLNLLSFEKSFVFFDSFAGNALIISINLVNDFPTKIKLQINKQIY